MVISLIAGFSTRGLEYGGFLLETFKTNWYHIVPGIIGIIVGIEIFKKRLMTNTPTSPSFWTTFSFVFKIWTLEAIINIGTNLLEGTIKFSNYDYFARLMSLIAISFVLFIIVVSISSLIIGGVIYKYGIKKITNTVYRK